ncbi:hypothetical protein L208DRAFT_569519 [Tricholoma matsutake]|nr:hypothetical protein L208DRAFT_569519 [Tricholoma matsutake 945]
MEVEPSMLVPGATYIFERRTQVSPQAILNGQPTHRDLSLHIVERRLEYTGLPGSPSIVFTMQGEPASVLSILTPGAQLDKGYDRIMEEREHRMMQYVIDWPRAVHRVERMRIRDSSGVSLTRFEVAKELCARLVENLKRRPEVADTLKWRYVRLVALSCYNGTWAPVWSIDSSRLQQQL